MSLKFHVRILSLYNSTMKIDNENWIRSNDSQYLRTQCLTRRARIVFIVLICFTPIILMCHEYYKGSVLKLYSE